MLSRKIICFTQTLHNNKFSKYEKNKPFGNITDVVCISDGHIEYGIFSEPNH